ncbi:hypothetical protein D3C77_15720 [compost metagenome]
MDAELGRLHAAACFRSASTFKERTLRTKAYADAALAELERIQNSGDEMLATLLRGGNQGAKLLNTDPYQGLREVIQNADDLRATSVMFGVRTVEDYQQLLIVHNGQPVELPHVVPMIYPFYSTKQNSAELKGRFGIGLKTLNQLGDHLTVHSAPFHFGSRDDFVAMVAEEPAIPGFYDPLADQTMVTVNLSPGYDLESLNAWFDDWAPSDLVFLDHVRSIALIDLDEGEILEELSITLARPVRKFSLQWGKHTNQVKQSTFQVGNALWERFVCEIKVPQGKARAAKATGHFTPIGVAIPVDGAAQGRLHVALPTKIHTNAAFSLDAQFDPSTSREDMIQDTWNEWLVEASGQFLGALAIQLAQEGNSLVWHIVPVSAKTDSGSEWLNKQFSEHWGKAVEAFKTCPSLINQQLGLEQISYCDRTIDDMLCEADHLEICGSPMLPLKMRDVDGRWREVLDALAASKVLRFKDVFTHCNEDGFGDKAAPWFLDIALRCLEADAQTHLLGSKWVPLIDGQRAEAEWDEEASCWLVSESPEIDLARRHQLARVVHPLLLEPPYAAILEWLKDSANYIAQPSAQHALQAFSRRYADSPITADRQDLLDLRDLFELVETDPDALGKEVGSAILIEAFSFEPTEDGRPAQNKTLASPTQLYLPASIADAQDGWSKAAGFTPGILWASTGYSEFFKVSRARFLVSDGETSSANRKRGVKRFLTLLGAAIAPRLELSTGLINTWLPSQSAARYYLRKVRGGLKRDFVSPDIVAVLGNIRETPVIPMTRKRGKTRATNASKAGLTAAERAVALFKSIDSNWSAFEKHCKTYAYRESNGRQDNTPVPTTWLATLIDSAWFPNAVDTLCRPRGLVIETKVTLALYEDHTNFARDLGESDANSEFARLLEMIVNPKVSQLVEAIDRARKKDSKDEAGLMRLYRALASHCPQSASAMSSDMMIGDVPLTSLRAKFGISRNKGLIAPCVTTKPEFKEWLSPNGIFSGKDIFHARKPFVIPERTLLPLWNALNIKQPDLMDCVRELASMAKEDYRPEVDALLIDIYRHMDRLLDRATASERRSLLALPLRTGCEWSTKRPLYYSNYPGVETDKVAMWEPPCALDSIAKFIKATGVEPLPFERLVNAHMSLATDEVQLRFKAALLILKADLARDDEESYLAMKQWERVAEARIHLHPTGQLIVNAKTKSVRSIPLRVHAHCDAEAFAVHFDDVKYIGRSDFGGAAIAGLGGGSRMRQIALAWVSAWASSEDAPYTPDINLAKDAQDANLDMLIAEQERLGGGVGRRKIVRRQESTQSNAKSAAPSQTRRLKTLPSEFSFTSDVTDGSDLTVKGPQQRNVKPLINPPSTPKRAHASPPSESSYPQYSGAELQQMAWAYVEASLAREDAVLADLQACRGIGADGALDEATFIEMKSFARAAPGEITLTEAEFRRASECATNFYLVIVSGLEEGFDTELRIFVNPIESLPWKPKGAVSVGGLLKGAKLFLKERQD